jgi:riboflavin kinase/FMN adenylyltransferase
LNIHGKKLKKKMKVFRNIDEVNIDKPTALTVGSFDGIHLGHQQILQELKKQAKDCNCLEVLITFHPHPKLIVGLQKNQKVELLTPLDEKLKILNDLSHPAVLVIPFTKAFSQISYKKFVEDILVNKLKIKKIVVGHNHAFGKNREGHSEQLKTLGNLFNFSVTVIQPFYYEGSVVSSSLIRKYLSEGKVEFAQKLLGRSYSIQGIVEGGEQRGHIIGYPTANIKHSDPNKMIPHSGVYAVDVKLKKSKYKGMMNIGNRPTFNFDPLTLEVHIFNFTGSIYNEDIEIFFKKFIRNEQKFSSLEELRSQIVKDKEICIKL